MNERTEAQPDPERWREIESFSAMAVMLYPNLPQRCLENLTLFAFSRYGVAWRSDLTLRDRVARAAAAHARHCHTRYDRLAPKHLIIRHHRSGMDLKEWRSRRESWARELVEPEVVRLLEVWAHGNVCRAYCER